MSAEAMAALRGVMIEGFALDEARLFLDTHPGDAAAQGFYTQAQAAYAAAEEAYAAQYGPLRIDDPAAAGSGWVCAPWPWETEG